MASPGSYRPLLEADRHEQRAAKKRQRDLERWTKQQAKLTEIEKARCEVELYENHLELLLSVHREQGPVWDWRAVAAALAAPIPRKRSDCELRARQLACLTWVNQDTAKANIDQARSADEEAYQQELRDHAAETADLEKLKSLAKRIIAGEPKAYTDALVELSPLGELSSLGSNLHFTVHGTDLLECVLKVNGSHAIPSEVKSLTATEKLSVKPLPRARFHELYQDYICGCVLRVAREVFSLLPLGTLLITATADVVDTTTGATAEQPVLSTIITRPSLERLDFERLDPSDTLETFRYRGNFKASRKAGAFAPIVPFCPADISDRIKPKSDAVTLLAEAKHQRVQVQAEWAKLQPVQSPPT